MTIPFGSQSIMVLRREITGRDRGGDDIYSTTQSTVDGCSVQPADSAEQLGSGDRITTRLRLFAPAGTDLWAVDAVSVAGVEYEVDGDPASWPNPFGGVHHVECYLRKATG